MHAYAGERTDEHTVSEGARTDQEGLVATRDTSWLGTLACACHPLRFQERSRRPQLPASMSMRAEGPM